MATYIDVQDFSSSTLKTLIPSHDKIILELSNVKLLTKATRVITELVMVASCGESNTKVKQFDH